MLDSISVSSLAVGAEDGAGGLYPLFLRFTNAFPETLRR